MMIPYRCLLTTVPKICPNHCQRMMDCGTIHIEHPDEKAYLLDLLHGTDDVFSEDITSRALPFQMAMKLGAL